MRKLFIVCAALVIMSTAAPSANAIGLYGGYWDAQDMDSGYGVGAMFKIPLIPIVDIDVRASYFWFSDAQPQKMTVVPLEVTGRLTFSLFYGGLGLGYYLWGADGDANANNQVGGYAVAGIKFAPVGIGAFGELKYTLVKTNVEDGVLSYDMKADGFGINIGVLFGF